MDQGGDERLAEKSKRFARKHAIFGFCLLISLLSFKPSEPYLSEYLTCNLTDQKAICSEAASDAEKCNSVLGGTCKWNEISSAGGNTQTTCEVESCKTVIQGCGMTDNAFRHCRTDKTSGLCIDMTCYKRFTESQVNNEIYPWSSYGYLPLLLILGSAAEVFSYRYTIILGIMGRLVTRYLLLFGTSLIEMQIMQLTYSMGSAAEDVFKAYVYYAVPEQKYQEATSYIAASALLSSVLAGLIADFLVLSGGVTLEVLMIISACFVTAGTAVSFVVIQPPNVGKRSASRASALSMGTGESKASLAYAKLIVQFHQLRAVLSNSSMRSLLIWWISGNAIYMVVYNYEVSIYNELNGSNDWNGTAIACILILGAGGAVAPVWMGVNKWDTQVARSSLQCDESKLQSQWSQGGSEQGPWVESPCRGVRGVTGGTSDPPPVESEHEAECESSLSPHPTTQSQGLPYHLSVGITILLTILSVFSALSLLLFLLSWSVVASTSMLALYFAAWQCVTAVFFVQLAFCLKSLVRQGKSQTATSRHEGSVFTIEGDEDDEGAEMTYSVTVQNPLTVKHASQYAKLSLEHNDVAVSRSTNISKPDEGPCIIPSCGSGSSSLSCATPLSPDTPVRDVHLMVDNDEEKETEKEQEEVMDNVSPPPPPAPANSLVFVAVVGTSALLQCILQTVLLSWLKCSLYVACSALAFLFFLCTSIFIVQSVLRIGPRTLLSHLLFYLPVPVTRQPQPQPQ